MTTLSKRLQTIHEMVPRGKAADVGADHGKLIISLVKNGIVDKGVAIENKIHPFERLVKAVKKENLEDKIVTLFSDGIKDIPEDVETLIIAGMGGFLILDILLTHKEKLKNVKTIIVDGHNAIEELRKGICPLGYAISDEKMVYESGIYYEIIKFEYSSPIFYDDLDISFGPILRKNKDNIFVAKWNDRIAQINNILKKENLSIGRIKELNTEKERILKVL